MNGKFRFFNIISIIDRFLIPKEARGTVFLLRKARTLVSIHLFLLIAAASFQIANSLVFHDMETPPLSIAIVIALALIFIFKKWGNFNLSGNLLAFFLFAVLFSATFDTGGLYSDNLLWMIVAPLLALLFANIRSGFFWLFALLGVAIYLYVLEIEAPVSYREKTFQFDGLYYLTTYIGLFTIIVGIVLIFATGQTMIIKALFEKQRELSEQKAELAKQTQSLIEAERKLKASNQELEHFAYAASHDLKEPLRMIGSYTQLIKRTLNKNLDGSTNEYMGYVTDGVSRMETLLNDLLEYSRLGRRSGSIREVDLNDTIFMVINNLMTAMKKNEAEIYANELPVIHGLATEMVQLFQNLISNSIKFKQPGVRPVIEIIHRYENETHVFEFQDNGIGIPPEHSEGVFNIFERLHSHHEYEGTGIGLATCKKIITNMGGRIWVEPNEEAGTTFIFTIPQGQAN